MVVTWRLSGARLQSAGLFGHWFGEGVTTSDQLPALVTLHVPHPHTDATCLSALKAHEARNTVIKHVCFAVILIYLHFESFRFHTRRLSVDSPQTRGWCTIWSMASRSRCFLLQASRSPHMPPHRRSGTFLRWCRRIERSSVSHHDHRLCCTAVKGKIFVALLTLKRDFVHLKFLHKALQIFHKK